MLEFQHVTFQYDSEDFNIIDDLSFTVEPEEFISIIGISGCGKSTIFKLTNGLLKRKSGYILLNGQDIASVKHAAGYMPQKDLLFPWRTIEKNLCLPMEIAKVPQSEQIQRVSDILKEVGLSDYAAKYPKDLSGGMRQRISFARTLLTDADLLLLDEPFSALDALTRISMQEWLLKQWQHFHKTIMFITHDVEEAVLLATKVIIMSARPGRIKKIVDINLPYPRTQEMKMELPFLDLKTYIWGEVYHEYLEVRK